MLKILVRVTTSMLLLGSMAATASSESAESFYSGRNVTLLVGVGPGGGNDAWARTIGRHMGKHIPGNPTIVPQNMPGGAGLRMTNYLYNAAPKDGSVFGLPNAGIVLEPLLGGKGVEFDPLKMNWIGSPDRDTTVCVARKDASVQTVDDLMNKELVVGASGSGGNTNIFPLFFSNAIGMRFKIIPGYTGTTDILLAVERGEVMGMCSSYDPIQRQSLYKAGKLRVLFQAAIVEDRSINAPTPMHLIADEAKRQALAFFLARAELGRPFVAPPGVPKERVQALRRAFDATMKDTDFLTDAAKQRFNVIALSGEKLTALIERIYQTPETTVRLTAKALGRSK